MLIFTYGTLKKGFHNHSVLGKAAVYIGHHTTKPCYTMYDLGFYPAISLLGNTAIVGEVYEVSDLENIDRLEGYPHFYNRIEIETKYGLAWVYHLVDDNIRYKVIESGEWKLFDYDI